MTHTTHHVASIKMYVGIFLALIVCTGLTVVVAKQDLGPLNVVAAMGIAVLKATLVVLFFMHVKWSGNLVKIVVGSAMLWLMILLLFTVSDYATRGWVPATLGW